MGCTATKTSAVESDAVVRSRQGPTHRRRSKRSPTSKSSFDTWIREEIFEKDESRAKPKSADMEVAIKILRCRVNEMEDHLVEALQSEKEVTKRTSALAAEMGIRVGSFVQTLSGKRGRVVNICQRGSGKCFVSLEGTRQPAQLVRLEHLVVLPEDLSED